MIAKPSDKLTASSLRANLYSILDQIISGKGPITLERKGMRIQIRLLSSEKKAVGKLEKIKKFSRKKSILKGDPEDLVSLNWEKEWNGRDLP